jgi:pimeloyl-ACP methyl ester carboxylesterase
MSGIDTIAPGVVLLHGIARTARSLHRLERSLQQAGFATLNLDYASRKKPLEMLAEDIHAEICAFADACSGPVHFVTHSMGGLLARVYLARHRPARLGRVVMLGTPNGGSEVADFLKSFPLYRAFYGPAGQQLTTKSDAALTSLPPVDYPVGVVAGTRTLDPIAWYFILPRPNDGRVSVESSKLDCMADHVTIKAPHNLLVSHPPRPRRRSRSCARDILYPPERRRRALPFKSPLRPAAFLPLMASGRASSNGYETT